MEGDSGKSDEPRLEILHPLNHRSYHHLLLLIHQNQQIRIESPVIRKSPRRCLQKSTATTRIECDSSISKRIQYKFEDEIPRNQSHRNRMELVLPSDSRPPRLFGPSSSISSPPWIWALLISFPAPSWNGCGGVAVD